MASDSDFEPENDLVVGLSTFVNLQKTSEELKQSTALWIVFAMHVYVLAIVLNFMVIVAVLRNKPIRNSTNILLCNLALSDILLVLHVFYSPIAFANFGQLLCQVILMILPVCIAVSSLTVTSLTIDCYLVTACPSKRCSPAVVTILVAALWLISLMVALPIGWFSESALAAISNQRMILTCSSRFPDKNSKLLMDLATGFLNLLLPLVTVVIFFGLVFQKLRETRRVTSGDQQLERLGQHRRNTVALLLVCVFFFVRWLPLVTMASVPFSVDGRLPVLAYCMAVSGAIANPLLFLLTSGSYREAILQLFPCRKPQTNELYKYELEEQS